MVESKLYDMVLNEINRQLESKGVIVKRGAIIDASITDAPRRPRGRKEYEVGSANLFLSHKVVVWVIQPPCCQKCS